MIRIVQRKLIIPRGDTGTFTIPAIMAASSGDVAIFTIFDCITHSKVFEKAVQSDTNNYVIEFTHNDTVNLKPGKYFVFSYDLIRILHHKGPLEMALKQITS